MELVHGVVFTAGFQSSFACEVLLVVVADVGASHVLVLDAGDALADFLALDVPDVAEHALAAEVFLGQVVGAQRRGVVGRQRDEVVEDPRLARRVGLEGADALIGLGGLFAGVPSAPNNGSDSSQGNVSATPAPRKKCRLEFWFIVHLPN